MREWLVNKAKVKAYRVDWVVAALQAQNVTSLRDLRHGLDRLSAHIPATAYNAIVKAFDQQTAEAASQKKQQQQLMRSNSRAPPPPKGLPVKYVWEGRSAEAVLAYTDLQCYDSVTALVKALARLGKEKLGASALEKAETALRPSTMRVEFKVNDHKTGVKRRCQLTPASQLTELEKAESLLVTPHVG